MSLVSIYTNRDIITKFYNSSSNYSQYENFDCREYVAKVISNCLIKQYDMMRKYLNKNAIEKRHFDSSLCGEKLLDAWYQHMFMHNYTALNDEYFEVYDAIKKFKKNKELLNIESKSFDTITINKEENIEKIKNDIFMSDLLITEEIIDVFHFILEYIVIIEEAYILTVAVNSEDITTDNLNYFFVDCDNEFYKSVVEMLDKEATHIAAYILDSDKQDMFNNSFADYSDENLVFFNTKINRDLVRETNFKDWKSYKFKQHFNQIKFANLFICTRNMFLGWQMMAKEFTRNYNALEQLLNITENERSTSALDFVHFNNSKEFDSAMNYINKNKDFNHFYHLVYSLYLAKREENIRRQGNGDQTKADPRYYSNGTGSVVGDKVS